MQIARVALAMGILLVSVLCVGIFVLAFVQPPTESSAFARRNDVHGNTYAAALTQEPVDRFFSNRNLTVWWDRDDLPGASTLGLAARGSVAQSASKGTEQAVRLISTNIHPDDYAGPEACQKCHEKNYDAWSNHSHRWMNTLATSETVKGDFSGVTISYLGGQAQFIQPVEGEYGMVFQRDGVRRRYKITQTIGSRFFQYYVGRLAEGPETADHLAYQIDHVMLFGFWLDRKEWVPAVHVGYDELPDGQREDPFARTLPAAPRSPYFQCNSCHTTFALGDELTRNFYSLGRHAPYPLHWNMPGYLGEARAELVLAANPRSVSNEHVESLLIGIQQFEAPEEAVALGVTCESCHLGCKDHAESPEQMPSFFPLSKHLNADTASLPIGREHVNVNWACGRCHAGERPYYAGGMATWNSTEFSDATKGGCYSQLNCVDCHNPHQTIGSKWAKTAAEDNASCVRCHEQFQSESAITAHTHHSADSAGSDCMNCHMPRVNEGLQEVVRTHTIFSPTKREMIETNQPNACNICHVEKPIDWTLEHLGRWYGAKYDEAKIAANYPLRNGPTAVGWLKHKNEAVRLAATDAVARSDDWSAVPALIDVLDDPFLLNRQFARVALERRFPVQLQDDGYQFYMTPEERPVPIGKVRERILGMQR